MHSLTSAIVRMDREITYRNMLPELMLDKKGLAGRRGRKMTEIDSALNTCPDVLDV
jgi:hypothetical protein